MRSICLKMGFITVLVWLFLGCTFAQNAFGNGAGKTDIWICPRITNPAELSKIFSKESDWFQAKSGTDVYKFFAGAIERMDQKELKAAVDFLNDAGIEIGVEIPPTSRSARQVKEYYDRIAAAGGRLKYADMDNPMGIWMDRHGGENPDLSEAKKKRLMKEAADWLVEWVSEAQQIMPDLQIGLIECVWRYSWNEYPPAIPAETFSGNDPPHGNMRVALDYLFERLDEENLELAFFHGEHARLKVMELAEGEGADIWGKLKAIEKYIRNKGLEFGIIYCDESTARWWPDRIRENTDKVFCRKVHEAVTEHIAAGGKLDDIVIQSWVKAPEDFLPESKWGTFSSLVKKVSGDIGSPVESAKQTVSGDDSTGPEIWICPSVHSIKKIRPIFSPDAAWGKAKANIDVFKFFSGALERMDPETMKQVVEFCKKEDIDIAVELPPISRSPEDLKRYSDKVADAGGKLKYADLDNGMGILLDKGWIGKTTHLRNIEKDYTLEGAAEWLADWIARSKKLVPDIEIGIIECVWRYSWNDYPASIPEKTFKDNNPPHGNMRVALDYLFKYLDEKDVEITFFHGEHARLKVMELAEGKDADIWGKLKAIEEYIKAKDLKFGIIYCDESTAWWWPERVKENTSEVFCNQVYDAVTEHLASGADVDDIVIQSWVSAPKDFLPENQWGTFSSLVKKVTEDIKIGK